MVALLLALSSLALPCFADQKPEVVVNPEVRPSKLPPGLNGVGISEKLGDFVDIEGLKFTDENGQKVNLSQIMAGSKPVVLMLGYYECPRLCSLVLNGFVATARNLAWTIGKEYEMVMVSVDPFETPELANKKKQNYVKSYGRIDSAKGWHFLTGDEENITKLTQQVGFVYRYDEKLKQYAHPAVMTVLTPKGKVSRYLYGIDFKSKDLKVAMFEAADGKIGSIVERVLLFCYQYDPASGSYSVTVASMMRIFGALTFFMMAIYLWVFWRKELLHSK